MANETREPGSANARDKRRRRVAAVALACTVLGVTVGALVIDATIGAPASTRSRDSTVEATVAAAEDIEVAYPYPLPPDTQPPQLFDANSLPHAWIDPNTHHAYIPPAVITRSLARLRDLCKAVFSAPMTSQVLQQANAALNDQSGGSDVAGMGGASVVNYNSVVVRGDSASVQALVSQWSVQGTVDSRTGKVICTHANTETLVTDTLSRVRSGSWIVKRRQWQFVPGHQP